MDSDIVGEPLATAFLRSSDKARKQKVNLRNRVQTIVQEFMDRNPDRTLMVLDIEGGKFPATDLFSGTVETKIGDA